MNKVEFGSYIKQARLSKHYTQQELADLLFVDVTTVSKWERGVNYPDITLVPDICKALDISEHELIASSHDVEYSKIKREAKKYNKMKKGTFWAINISCLLVIIVCFVVNLSVNHTLSWFYIVLAAITCAYTFCPTITWLFNKGKKLVFMTSTFISMSLLFITCSVYAGNYWFMIAILGVLLGYFVIGYPLTFSFLKKQLEENKYRKLSRWFFLSYVLGMLVTIIGLLIAIYAYKSYDLKLALLITGGCFVLPIVLGILSACGVNKNINKIILFSVLGIIVISILIALVRTLYCKSGEVVKTYFVNDTYTDIKIEGNTFDVNVYLSKDDENKVVYFENRKITVESKVEDGVLVVKQHDERKFYDKLFNFSDIEVNLYLTQEAIDSIDISLKTGDIKIDKGFIFKEVNIKGATGDIQLKSNVSNNLIINNSTGDVEIEDINIGGELKVQVTTGDIDITNVNCNKLDLTVSTGDTKLVNTLVATDFNMMGKTGSLYLDRFDAGNIYVILSTGDVKGTILSSKIYLVKSKTGKVDVPETLTGGVCKITVGTGDVKIN